MVVCDGIAPNDGKKLFEAMRSTDLEKPDPFADDLLRTLMSACKNSYQQKYKNADPQSVCLQVLNQFSKKVAPTIWKVINASNSQSTVPRKESRTR